MRKIAIVLALMLSLCSCGSTETTKVNPEVGGDRERFTMELENIDSYTEFYVITDNETGVQYLYVIGSNNQRSGIVKLEPKQ